MKVKALFATLIVGALATSAHAGTGWSSSGKSGKVSYTEPSSCDKCEDIGGSITVGYDTDYVWKGIRWSGDNVWADVNYTFENLPLSPNIGVWHLSSLDSGAGTYGDETNFYASANLPSMLGFDTSVGYVLALFPTTRGVSGSLGNTGDSFSRVTFTASREVFSGLNFTYMAEYYFGGDLLADDIDNDLGDWYHTFGLAKSFSLFPCTSLDLSAEVTYVDSFWSGLGLANNGSGFNNYLLKAAMPVSLNNRTTLTPYVAYNGTPDGWKADNVNSGTISGNSNLNDVFFGGVSLGVTW